MDIRLFLEVKMSHAEQNRGAIRIGIVTPEGIEKLTYPEDQDV